MKTSDTTMAEFYSQEDVQQILQIAIARQAQSGEELTRTQLLEIADDMGISPTDLQIAEQEWVLQRGEAQERQAFDHCRRSVFNQHATRFAIVNAFLISLDLLTGGGVNWSLYVTLFWGLGLSLKGWQTFQLKGEEYEDAFQRWRRKRWIKRSVNTFLNRWIKPNC